MNKSIATILLLSFTFVSSLASAGPTNEVYGQRFLTHPIELKTSTLSCGGTLSFPINHGDWGSAPWVSVGVSFDVAQVESLNIPAAEAQAFKDFADAIASGNLMPANSFIMGAESFDPLCSDIQKGKASIKSASFVRRMYWSSHENAKGETTHCNYGYGTRAVVEVLVQNEEFELDTELWNPTASAHFRTNNAQDCNEATAERLLGL